MAPSVSVVIPSFQGAVRLPGLLAALAAQRFDREWEVILVLDGSTDGSASIAEAFAENLNLVILDRGFNVGRSTTLNDGLAAASGDVLVRCDDDLLPDEHYVARFADWFEGDRSVGVVGLYRNVYPDTAYAKAYGRSVDERFRREAYASAPGTHWQYWAGNCAVHRQMWERVGPYDADTYRAYGWEDVDWGYRFQAAGGRIVLDPQLETVHRVAATTCAIRADRAELSGAAARLFDLKHATCSLPPLSGSWGAAVRATARGMPVGWSAAVDGALPHVPQKAGRKLVDLVIQSSFRRGYLTART